MGRSDGTLPEQWNVDATSIAVAACARWGAWDEAWALLGENGSKGDNGSKNGDRQAPEPDQSTQPDQPNQSTALVQSTATIKHQNQSTATTKAPVKNLPRLARGQVLYRDTSLIRNSAPLGPYRRPLPRALW